MSLAATALTLDRGGKRVVDGVDAAFAPGELVALIGPNGAGKSSLLRLLAGLVRPDAGLVVLDGRPLARWRPAELGRRLSYLPQTPESAWSLTVADLVALGRHPHRAPLAGPSTADRDAVARALTRCDVAAFADRDIRTLSGGEAMRAHLARALATEAPILLADEPVASLDPRHQLAIMNLLRALAHDGRTVLAVLHDLTLATRFCDRLLLLDRGRLVAAGAPAAVLTDMAMRRVFGVAVRRQAAAGDGLVLPWTLASE
jgi:iron complex transport system ATP-binding protein